MRRRARVRGDTLSPGAIEGARRLCTGRSESAVEDVTAMDLRREAAVGVGEGAITPREPVQREGKEEGKVEREVVGGCGGVRWRGGGGERIVGGGKGVVSGEGVEGGGVRAV